jgi:CMP-N,N'-diacetyllegionaminic acid synthase
MYKNKKILAIIPARGGSKGVRFKNIKEINGKPLISYTICEALKSKYIDKLIVSTENEKIKEVSAIYGAEVPFIRPDKLAQDNTPGIDPIVHSVLWFKERGENFDYVLCIQCTSPFRKAQQIDEAVEKLIEENADSIVSICESEVSPYWMKKIENERLVNFIEDKVAYARRQDVPSVYRLNGSIYMARTDVLLNVNNWYTSNTLYYIMDKITSIDIDDIIDFKFAEFLMKEGYNG